MKEKMVYSFLVLFLVVLTGTSVLYAEGDDSLISQEGAGPMVSEGTGTSAPEVGSAGPVGVIADQDDESGSDPSAFEGDSGSAPGERAPEELPMSDTPVNSGVGID